MSDFHLSRGEYLQTLPLAKRAEWLLGQLEEADANRFALYGSLQSAINARNQALEALRRSVDFCHEILDEHQPEGDLCERTRQHLARLAETLRLLAPA